MTSSKKFPRQQIVKYLFFKGLEDFKGGTAAQMDGWNAHCRAFTVSNDSCVDSGSECLGQGDFPGKELIVEILEKKTALSTSDSFSYGVPLRSPPPPAILRKKRYLAKG